MPVTLKRAQMSYKDSYDNYVGVDVIAERTTAEQVAEIEETGQQYLDDIEASGATTIENVEQAVSDSQDAIAGIDAQRDTMIAAIASVAGQGTDTTLTQSGVAADASAVGNLKAAIEEEIGVQNVELQFGYYENNTTGAVITNPTSTDKFVCAMIPYAGEQITVNLYGADSARVLAYLNADHEVIRPAGKNTHLTDYTLDPNNIPEGTAYICFNNQLSKLGSGFYVRVGQYPVADIKNLKNYVDSTSEETENLFSFSKRMMENEVLDVQFINSSEIIINGTKSSSTTYWYPMGNEAQFVYNKFNPNLQPGTYRVHKQVFTTENTMGELRVRYREAGGVNGTNLTNGVYTFANPVEIYVVLPNGQTVYEDCHVQWQITAGEEEQRFIPGGISSIDLVSRSKIDQLLYSNLDVAYENVAFVINKLRQPGDLLLLAGSDYHFHNEENEKKLLSKYALFARCIAADYMTELGDNVRGYEYEDDTPDYMRKAMLVLNGILREAQRTMLYVVGNHDDADLYVKYHSEDANDFISDNELRNYYVLSSDPRAVKTDGLHYHIDDEKHMIRYIVLNSSDIPKINVNGEAKYYPTNIGGFRNTQINWLKDRLADTPEDYGIVILVHYPITRTGEEHKNFEAVKSLIVACHHGTSYSSSGAEEDFEYSVEADFTDHAKKVLCVICGHTHNANLLNLETGLPFAEGDTVVADGIPLIVQDNGEDYQSAYLINRDTITRIALRSCETVEIDISGT